jgi:hypothetical protein
LWFSAKTLLEAATGLRGGEKIDVARVGRSGRIGNRENCFPIT